MLPALWSMAAPSTVAAAAQGGATALMPTLSLATLLVIVAALALTVADRKSTRLNSSHRT